MYDIYSRADRVVVWLGPESADTEKAIEAISMLGSDLAVHWTDSRLGDSVFALWLGIMGEEWWRRVWTVQETVLATKLVYTCGSFEISDTVMEGMAASYFTHIGQRCCHFGDLDSRHGIFFANELGNMMTEIENMRELRHLGDGPKTFVEVATIFGARDATDVRDKVFGLLGISAESAPSWWTIC